MYIYIHFPTYDWVIPLKQCEESVVAIAASLTGETVQELHTSYENIRIA